VVFVMRRDCHCGCELERALNENVVACLNLGLCPMLSVV
jgi:hypothetical protein